MDDYGNLDLIGNARSDSMLYKRNGARRLFFNTIFPAQLQIFCVWQEKPPLNRTGSIWMQYIPLLLYLFSAIVQ